MTDGKNHWLEAAGSNAPSLNMFEPAVPKKNSSAKEKRIWRAGLTISVIGIVTVLAVAATFPFINGQLQSLYPKKESNAQSITPTDIPNSPTSTPAVSNTTKGDIDGNGKVDVYDLGIFASFYDQLVSASDEDHKKASDLNSNQKVDVYDLGLLAGEYQLQTTSSGFGDTSLDDSSTTDVESVMTDLDSLLNDPSFSTDGGSDLNFDLNF